jgi:hypothetical protein
MRKNPIPALGMLFILSITFLNTHSQCVQPPPLDSCSGTEPSVSDNEILTSGTKKWYYGPTTTLNELTLRGGTLVVCGDLTVDKFYMDSGQIIVRPGARFVIGGGIGSGLVLRGNSAIYNYGRFQCIRNLSLDNTYASATKPNVILNVLPSSDFKMSNQYLVINNPYSFFVNNGKADFHGIITDPGSATGAVCLGNGSQTKMTVFYNRKFNSYAVPSGSACLNVSEYSQMYDSVTTSPNLNTCLGPTHYSDSSCRPWGCKPNAWGRANLFRGCNSCMEVQVLSIQFIRFVAQENMEGMQLQWATTSAANADTKFLILCSADGKTFTEIGTVEPVAENLVSNYVFIDRNPLPGVIFYRIVYVHKLSGQKKNSETIKISLHKNYSYLYPNPFKKTFTMNFKAGKKPTSLEFYNTQGSLIHKQPVLLSQANSIQVSLPLNMPAGSYLLKIIYPMETEIKRILKEE